MEDEPIFLSVHEQHGHSPPASATANTVIATATATTSGLALLVLRLQSRQRRGRVGHKGTNAEEPSQAATTRGLRGIEVQVGAKERREIMRVNGRWAQTETREKDIKTHRHT